MRRYGPNNNEKAAREILEHRERYDQPGSAFIVLWAERTLRPRQ